MRRRGPPDDMIRKVTWDNPKTFCPNHHASGPTMAEHCNDKRIGYCTNVHAGTDLSSMLGNVGRCAPSSEPNWQRTPPCPVGLWLSRESLDDALRLPPGGLRRKIEEMGLQVFTLNGFPYGNFRVSRVKHDVYQPDWSRPERLRYTTDLADVLIDLVPEGATAGISTLPIGWSDVDEAHLDEAVSNLGRIVDHLAMIESRTGCCLHLDLEPEPGCLLQRSNDVVGLFERILLATSREDDTRRHLHVCHDVCHAAVMFESQRDVIDNHDSAGIAIGKVQVSTMARKPEATTRPTERLTVFRRTTMAASGVHQE